MNLSNSYSKPLGSSQEKISNLLAILYRYYKNASDDRIIIEKSEWLEIIEKCAEVSEEIRQVLKDIESKKKL